MKVADGAGAQELLPAVHNVADRRQAEADIHLRWRRRLADYWAARRNTLGKAQKVRSRSGISVSPPRRILRVEVKPRHAGIIVRPDGRQPEPYHAAPTVPLAMETAAEPGNAGEREQGRWRRWPAGRRRTDTVASAGAAAIRMINEKMPPAKTGNRRPTNGQVGFARLRAIGYPSSTVAADCGVAGRVDQDRRDRAAIGPMSRRSTGTAPSTLRWSLRR